MCRLHHIAVTTKNFDDYKMLFKELGMTVEREVGKFPQRQLWFYEGIQLKEVLNLETGLSVDHIALVTEDINGTIKVAVSNGCKHEPKKDNWFILSNGTKVELIEN